MGICIINNKNNDELNFLFAEKSLMKKKETGNVDFQPREKKAKVELVKNK